MDLPGDRGKMRAADADRDRVAGFLNAAYTEGRLSKDEYDTRLDSALSARAYADLDQVVTDRPVAPATVVTPAAKTTTVTPWPRPTGSPRRAWHAGSRSSRPGRWRPSRRSSAATWPAARSSAPENKERAWHWRA